MFRSILGVVLASSCATRAPELPTPAALDARLTARAWIPADESAQLEGAFLLMAPPRVADDLASVATACGFVTRPATEDDLRESWPILGAHEELDARGRAQVAWDVRAAGHPALVNLWVELRLQQESGRELDPAALGYLAAAL